MAQNLSICGAVHGPEAAEQLEIGPFFLHHEQSAK